MIIGITGTIASGKGKVADYIHDKYGFKHHSFSMAIRKEAEKRGIEINRKNLHYLGAILNKERPDKSILDEKIIKRINADKKKKIKNFVVEGIRDITEINGLKKSDKKFFLIGVDANQKIRFKRLKKRKRNGDPKTFIEFKRIDDLETSAEGGQQVGKCMKKADFIINNDGTLNEMNKKIDNVMKKIIGGKK